MLSCPRKRNLKYRDKSIGLRNRRILLADDEIRGCLSLCSGLFDFIVNEVDLSAPYEDTISTIGDWAGSNLNGYVAEFSARRALIGIYGFAIINGDFISAVASLGLPVIDLGAGTGYITYELQKSGIDAVAYDVSPPKKKSNKYGFSAEWCNVKEGDTSILDHMGDHALLLSWPNYDSEFGCDAINRFRGDYLILIHEGDGGCVGSSEMYSLLDSGWDEHQEIDIPQWSGIHDYVTIFKRSPSKDVRGLVKELSDRDIPF